MLDTKDKIVKAITQVWDFKTLSRDLVNTLVDRALKQKDLVIEALAGEFTKFLAKINITEELQKVLEGMTLDIETTIHLKAKPNSKSKKPEIISKSKTKKTMKIE